VPRDRRAGPSISTIRDTPPVAAGRFIVPPLFPTNNRTTIHFVRLDESDFGIGSGGSRLDLLIRKELMRRKSRIEHDEDLLPQGIESVTLDGTDHRNEILFLVQIVGSIDSVDARVLPDDRGGGSVRQ